MVDETGYDYIWRSRKVPYLVRGRNYVNCYTHRDCPFIYTLTQAEATEQASKGAETEENVEPSPSQNPIDEEPDIGIPGGEISTSPVTPTGKPKSRAKAKAQAKAKAKQSDELILPETEEVPPPPIVNEAEVRRIVKERLKKRI